MTIEILLRNPIFFKYACCRTDTFLSPLLRIKMMAEVAILDGFERKLPVENECEKLASENTSAKALTSYGAAAAFLLFLAGISAAIFAFFMEVFYDCVQKLVGVQKGTRHFK